MNPLLIDYYSRFDFPKVAPTSTFFTHISADKAFAELPYLYDIEYFCSRLTQALEKHEKICIYSDYDTDAVTATGVMYWGLIELGFDPKNLSYYAPDRFTEGYGINKDALVELSKKNNLIISVDCGINSVAEVDAIKQSGCDVIITDHHHLQHTIPDAYAVINPRLSEHYALHSDSLQQTQTILETINLTPASFAISPEKFLSSSITGVGVAWFCVVWLGFHLYHINREIAVMALNKLLPLVAIGTVADCQSIIEPTNRLLVKSGLHIMQKRQHNLYGLEALLAQTGLAQKIDEGYKLVSSDLGFTLSPILNASGRISHAQLSIALVNAATKQIAQEKAELLIATNTERKNIVKESLAEITSKLAEINTSKESLIWLEGAWSKGIVGLIASRIVNQYNLPCIVVSLEGEELASGSMRAPEGYHLPNAMEDCGMDLFEKGGGHPGAAGFTAKISQLPIIKDRMQEVIARQKSTITIPDIRFSPTEIEVPTSFDLLSHRKEIIWANESDITSDTLKEIWHLEPFGQDFPLPKLAFQAQKPKFSLFGSEQQYLRIILANGIKVSFFNLNKKRLDELVGHLTSTHNSIWILAKPSQNVWRSTVTQELMGESIEYDL